MLTVNAENDWVTMENKIVKMFLFRVGLTLCKTLCFMDSKILSPGYFLTTAAAQASANSIKIKLGLT